MYIFSLYINNRDIISWISLHDRLLQTVNAFCSLHRPTRKVYPSAHKVHSPRTTRRPWLGVCSLNEVNVVSRIQAPGASSTRNFLLYNLKSRKYEHFFLNGSLEYMSVYLVYKQTTRWITQNNSVLSGCVALLFIFRFMTSWPWVVKQNHVRIIDPLPVAYSPSLGAEMSSHVNRDSQKQKSNSRTACLRFCLLKMPFDVLIDRGIRRRPHGTFWWVGWTDYWSNSQSGARTSVYCMPCVHVVWMI